MTLAPRCAAALIAMALLAPLCGRVAEARLPALGIDGVGNFYVTLRAASAAAPSSSVPPLLRGPADRLRSLVEFLPDSLPLRTEAKTVLIVHRRNPKYRSHVERLLWRRLDPYLSAPGSPAEIPGIISGAAVDLKPLCHEGADSIRVVLADLYRSAFPLFQSSLWPAARRDLELWSSAFDDSIRPGEDRLLGNISRVLALPLPDSTKVRIRLVKDRLPEGNGIYSAPDGGYLILVECEEPVLGRGAILLLRRYLRVADALAPADAVSAPRRLAGAIDALASGEAAAIAGLPDAFLDYVVARALESSLGWSIPPIAPEQERVQSVIKRHWDAYLAGGITMETACKAIVSDAADRSPP